MRVALAEATCVRSAPILCSLKMADTLATQRPEKTEVGAASSARNRPSLHVRSNDEEINIACRVRFVLPAGGELCGSQTAGAETKTRGP